MAEQLPNALRRETECRERGESYSKREHLVTDRLFAMGGYFTDDIIRKLRGKFRRYQPTDLRKVRHNRKPSKALRLTMGVLALFPVQKDGGTPKFEEETIPVKLRKWAHLMRNVNGVFIPDQEECDHIISEPASGRRK